MAQKKSHGEMTLAPIFKSSSSSTTSSIDQSIKLLHDIILLLGYFALENERNQHLLRFGRCPVILQHLVMLPMPYFCNPR